ncbi:MAG: class I SAM-dependent methyltransferase [Oscillospiraceae bacterium]|nr:class I SAM-dependent methyltransferase [Oscillospiraceae bacterium]
MIRLPDRLRVLAGFIPPGARVADIGTDHARLPVWLVQSGRAARVVATDIREKPLVRARRLVERCGLEAAIRLVQADGLQGLFGERPDTVVIAGMGADTIAEILRAAPSLPGAIFLMQPMTHAERLRLFLARHGYELYGERLAAEGGRLYNILAARPGGPCVTPPPAAWYVGPALRAAEDPLFSAYLASQIRRLRAEALALAASRKPADADRLVCVRSALTELEAYGPPNNIQAREMS